MRLTLLCFTALLSLFALALPASAAGAGGFEGEPTLLPQEQEPGIYRLPASARDALLDVQAEVRHERHERHKSGDFIAELSALQVRNLRVAGITVVQLFPSRRAEREASGSMKAAAGFTPYAQMRSDFLALAAAHPNIVKYVVMGSRCLGASCLACASVGT